MNDKELLRDLQVALEQTAGQGHAAQAKAIEAVLARHGATLSDIQRLLLAARRRRYAEIARLHARLDGLIAEREVAQETADAADRFLRRRAQGA